MNSLATGAFLVALAIVLGAFGSHALSSLPPAEARFWAIATQYHFIGALGVVALGLSSRPSAAPRAPSLILILGVLLFSGSLYAMALGAPRRLGVLTPIGGICLILGWTWLGLRALRHPSH
jgi:uncharacterized membrane protein YgdD (TMEM256/DUF423 family)